MAELCNVSPKTISHVERGLAKINTGILQALVRKKNLNVNWLLTGKGHPIAGAAERRIDAVDVRGSVESLEKRLLRFERLIGRLAKKEGFIDKVRETISTTCFLKSEEQRCELQSISSIAI